MAIPSKDIRKNIPRSRKSPPMYEETTKEAPDQTSFTTTEISQGSFDDDDGLEMVKVQLALRSPSTIEDDVFRDERSSNEKLLLTAFCTFAAFTICQTTVAFIADSEAMLGDSGAMFIDALSYLFNLYAERRKTRFEEYYQRLQLKPCDDPDRRAKLKQRIKRKMILHMEIIPPILSVITLLCVTGLVLHTSLRMLVLDTKRARSEQGDPNVTLMLVFSCLNLVLDMVNITGFARAKRLCGYKTIPQPVVPGITDKKVVESPLIGRNRKYVKLGNSSEAMAKTYEKGIETLDLENGDSQHGLNELKKDLRKEFSTEAFDDEPNNTMGASSKGEITEDNRNDREGVPRKKVETKQDKNDNDDDDILHEEANLNMCSAYTVSH
jgi:hypothetical protein